MNKEIILTRKANETDVVDILGVHRLCVKKINAMVYSPAVIKEWLFQIRKKKLILQLKNSSWLVLTLNKKIIGFAQYDLKTQELYQINIAPKFGGLGYGKRLYYYVENVFIKSKKGHITLNSTLNALGFYKSLGFRKIKALRFKLFKEEVGMVKMKKLLNEQKVFK